MSVAIYEAAPKGIIYGAGIGMWPRTWEVLRKVGLADELKKVSLSFPADNDPLTFSFRKSDQREGIEFFNMQGRGSMRTFHRSDFQQKLLEHIPPHYRIQYAKRLKFFSRSRHGELDLHFEDGSYDTCDLLVGADGIGSPTRACVLREKVAEAQRHGRPRGEIDALLDCIRPQFSGYIAYRSVIPTQRLQGTALKPKSPVMYLGKNSSILAYPIALGQMMNLVVFGFDREAEGSAYRSQWSEQVDASEVYNITSFEKWEPEAQAWLECVHNPTKWAIHTVKPLPTFMSHNVALLGDAAHAFTPHQGTGAGQAIEDAYVLAELLGHPQTTREAISRTLRIYDSIRRPWVQEIAERARLNGHCLALDFEGFDFDNASSDAVAKQLRRMGDFLADNWRWCWDSSVQESLDAAIRLLEAE
ncbi:hypothetical protein PQX77_005933 [Marasmius sp. AFHP31]|nr:hypothetical protein PQX77_005933 [Marasmius sp. AFHP31]